MARKKTVRANRDALMCRQAVELVTDYLEGTLAADERARFEAHLAACPHCTEYLREMRLTIAALGRVEPESLSADARADLVALYRSWRTG
jgi:anti-sigma factor RsiW